MSDTGAVIRVTFFGGPADGGELDMLEPLPLAVTFPMTAVRAAVTLANPQPPASESFGGSAWVNATPTSTYKLTLDGRRLLRDSRRRVVYHYSPAAAPAVPGNPTEGEDR